MFKQFQQGYWNNERDRTNILNEIITRHEISNVVVSRESSPPSSPTTGVYYLIIATASGRFLSNEMNLAYYYKGNWRIVIPHEGMIVYDMTLSQLIFFDGSGWVTFLDLISQYFTSVDHNQCLNYDEFEHIDWSEPGLVVIDKSRIKDAVQQLFENCIKISHNDTLDYNEYEHIDWSEPGLDRIDSERLPAAEDHIVDADGTLADITTKFNTLLAQLESYKILNTS